VTVTYLSEANINICCTNNFPCFTCYFETYLQTPEHIHSGHFKYVKLVKYLVKVEIWYMIPVTSALLGLQRGGGHTLTIHTIHPVLLVCVIIYKLIANGT
jgi:hypothetical protein